MDDGHPCLPATVAVMVVVPAGADGRRQPMLPSLDPVAGVVGWPTWSAVGLVGVEASGRVVGAAAAPMPAAPLRPDPPSTSSGWVDGRCGHLNASPYATHPAPCVVDSQRSDAVCIRVDPGAHAGHPCPSAHRRDGLFGRILAEGREMLGDPAGEAVDVGQLADHVAPALLGIEVEVVEATV